MVDVVELVEVAGKVAAVDPLLVSDDELCSWVRGIEDARASLDVASLAVLAELDSRDVTDIRFGLTTGAWLARQAKGSVGGARRRVRIARKIRERFPMLADALACRAISFEHVKVLLRACNPRIADELASLQEELIELSRGMVFEDWKRQVEDIANTLDQDGAFDPNDDLDRNQLSISATLDGITKLDGTLTGDSAVVVSELVNAKADELYKRFAADHKAHPELEMPSRKTLMALALVELVRAGAAVDLASTRTPATEAHLIIPAGAPLSEPADNEQADTERPGSEPGGEEPAQQPEPHPQDVQDHADDRDDVPAEEADDDWWLEDPVDPDTYTASGPPPATPRPPRPASPGGLFLPGREPPDHDHRSCAHHGPDPHAPPDWLDPYDLGPSSKLARILAQTPRVTTRHGVALADGTVRLLCCDALWTPIVVDNLGMPLDMGRERRLATDAQRKAIAIRDGGCVFDGCPNPVSWCDIHHIEFWDNGGTTNIDNMAALCRRCHGITHRTGWTMRSLGDGWFAWTTPGGEIIPSQRHHRRRAA